MLRIRSFRLIAAAVALASFMPFILAAPSMGEEEPSNGIYIGHWRQYDDRTIAQMVRQLKQSLVKLFTVPSDAVAKAISAVQGSTSSGSSFQLNVGNLTGGSKSVTVAPSSKGPGDATTVNTTYNYGSPLSASSGTAPALSGTSLGLSAEDTMNDAVNLAFAATNLSYVLSNSVSDIQPVGSLCFARRRQVVLAIQIDIRPRPEDRDKVAKISFKLCPAKSALPKEPISVSYIFPAKDTYNVTSVTQRTSGIGLAIPIATIPVGIGGSSLSGTSYIVKDIDTMAFTTEPKGNSVEFGWQFRPVLGRHFVDQGPRTVFVVLSVPYAVGTYPISFTQWSAWYPWDGSSGIIAKKRDPETFIASCPKELDIVSIDRIAELLSPIVNNVFTTIPHRAHATSPGEWPEVSPTATPFPLQTSASPAKALSLDVQATLVAQSSEPSAASTPDASIHMSDSEGSTIVRTITGFNLRFLDTAFINSKPYEIGDIGDDPSLMELTAAGVSVNRTYDGSLRLCAPASELEAGKQVILVGPYGSIAIPVNTDGHAPAPDSVFVAPLAIGSDDSIICWNDKTCKTDPGKKFKPDTVRILLHGRWYSVDTTYTLTDLLPGALGITKHATELPSFTLLATLDDNRLILSLPHRLLQSARYYMHNHQLFLYLGSAKKGYIYELCGSCCPLIQQNPPSKPTTRHRAAGK